MDHNLKKFNNTEISLKQLDTNFVNIAKEAVHLLFNHTYRLWEEYKAAKGIQIGMDVYASFWIDFASKAFKAAVFELNIKEVKDLSTFGKILKYMMSKAPSIYEIVLDEPDLHVGHVKWCANPGTNKFLSEGYNTGSYLRAEGYITPPYLNSYLNEAKKLGLDEDFIIGCNAAMCVDCSKPCCQYFVSKPNIEKTRFPELPASFLYDDIGTENPLPYILKQLNKDDKKQAVESVAGVAFVDLLGWQQMFLLNINDHSYVSLWKKHFSKWWNDALLDLKIAPPSDIIELVIVFIYCMKKRFTLYSISNKTNQSIQLISIYNPFIDESPEPLPKEYCKNMVQVEKAIIQEMIKKSNITENLKFDFISHRAFGDKETCIEIEVR